MKTKFKMTFLTGVMLTTSLQISNAMQDERARTKITITYHGATVNNQAQKIDSSFFEPWPTISILAKNGQLMAVKKLEQYGDTVAFIPSKKGMLSSHVSHSGLPSQGGMFQYTSGDKFSDILLPEMGKNFGLYLTLTSTEEKNPRDKNIATISFKFVEIK